MSDMSRPVAYRAGGDLSDFFALAKPRVMSLVVFTGIVGMALAPATPHPVLAVAALLALALGAGGAGAINMWFDRDIDAVMERTKTRPVPAGRVPAAEALAFGVTLSIFGVLLMGLAANWAAAALLLASSLFYVFVYTCWLKRSTAQNIVIGGAAGALPPAIGWVAATGGLAALPVILFAIIFLWTPAHFWALALVRTDDYARAGVPMLPVTRGAAATRRGILVYSAATAAVTTLPYVLGELGAVYGIGAGLLGAGLLWHALTICRRRTGSEMRMFWYSIGYLFLLFLLMPLDRLLVGP